MKRTFYKGRFLFIPFGIAAFLALISLVVMGLWNNLLPAILHVGVITFWQAMGIFILSKILFGFGKGSRGFGGGAPSMRQRMEERFKNMGPEEKERFKQKMQQRCGGRNWGRGDRHPFEAEWDVNAAEAAVPKE